MLQFLGKVIQVISDTLTHGDNIILKFCLVTDEMEN